MCTRDENALARSGNSGEGSDNHLAAGVGHDVTPEAPQQLAEGFGRLLAELAALTAAQGVVWGDLDAAYAAGFEAGQRARVREEATELAREVLHEQACAALGLAVRHAKVKGPGWATMIREQAEAGDEL